VEIFYYDLKDLRLFWKPADPALKLGSIPRRPYSSGRLYENADWFEYSASPTDFVADDLENAADELIPPGLQMYTSFSRG
jgi:hypothetical protein